MKTKLFTTKTITRIALLTSAVFLMTLTNAQQYTYNDSWGKDGFNLAEQTRAGVNVFYSVTKFSLDDFEVNGEAMKVVSLPELSLPGDQGAPDLPGNGRYIAIPEGATAELNIIAQRIERIQNVEIAPASNMPREDDDRPLIYEKDQAIYGNNAFYPAEPIKISEVTQLRGVDAVMLGITPFQYNPVTKELLVYRDIEIGITFNGGDGHFGEDRLRSRWFDPILSDAMLNYRSLPVIDYSRRTLNQRSETGCEYLIVSPDGDDFQSWADSIRMFRIKQGILTNVVTLTEIGGNTPNILENYFNNAYNNWDISPVAVLLLGDYGSNMDNNITSPIYDNYCVSDNIFADVSGNHMPDMVFARITANNNTQLEVMVTKFLDYERTPPENEYFYDHPVTAMGWQTERWFQLCSEIINGFFEHGQGKEPVRENAIYSGSPGSTWSSNGNTSTIVNYFGPNGLGYIPQTPAHLTDWGGNATRLNNDINSGCFLIQHRDHGSQTGWGEPAYNNSNINGCHNEDLTFVLSINCLTGKYNISGECFTEKFHRHTDNGENAGALGLIAASEVSYSFVNDTYTWGVYDNLWPEFMPAESSTPEPRGVKPAFGNAGGKYFLQQSNWPTNPGNKEVTYNLFHHHGDAFLTLYSEMPEDLSVSHAGVILAGLDYFNITVDEDAFVALTVGDQIIGTGTGTGGQITIPIVPQIPGTVVDLVITKQNYYRYSEAIMVINPDGAYCIYYGHSFSDPNGNNNGYADYNEDILLSLTLENLGMQDGIDIETSINSMSQHISFVDTEEIFDSIPSDGTATATDGFEFIIAEYVEDMTEVNIDITSTDGVDTWNSEFTFSIHAPSLGVTELIVDDSQYGNDNGLMDPGEILDIKIGVNNTGHCPAVEALGTIDLNCPYVIVENDSYDIGTIQLLGTYYAIFTISIDSATPPGVMSYIDFQVEADGYTADDSFEEEIGALIEDWETGDFTKFDWQFTGNFDWMISTTSWEGNYSSVSGNISNDESSEIFLEADVSHYDEISFYVKTSSESGRDMAQFYIDNTLQGEWSGIMDEWEHVSYPVYGGSHTFRWVYSKDDFLSMGGDCFWVDYIEFPPMPVLSAFAGHDDNSCIGSDFPTQGVVTSATTIEWTTSGTGTFDDPTILTSIYSPSQEDYDDGQIKLTLTVHDAEGNSDTDFMFLSFITEPNAPVTPSGPDFVDLFTTTTTTYETEIVEWADMYEWAIDPVEAGITESTVDTAAIEWNPDYLGFAYITVRAMNDCGNSEWSESYEVTIGNTVDIPEQHTEEAVVIYPNPSTGLFNVNITTARSEKISIKVYSLTGNMIYQKDFDTDGSKFNTVLDLNKHAEGLYFVKVEGSSTNYCNKIIIE